MSHVLVTFEKDWADEFDACGMRAYTAEEWAEELRLYKKYGHREFSFYFGTNEGWGEYSTGTDDTWNDILKNDMKVQKITEVEYNFLKPICGNDRFGQFPELSSLAEDFDDEDC